MNNAFRNIIFIGILLAALGTNAQIQEIKREAGTSSRTTYRVTLFDKTIDINQDTAKDALYSGFAVEDRMGRMQRHIFYPPTMKHVFGKEVKTWFSKDANTAWFGIEMPLFLNDKEAGTALINAVQLKSVPGWVFFRYEKFMQLSVGPALRGQVQLKQERKLYCAFPGKTVEIGEDVPGIGKKPDFSAQIYFSRGGGDENLSEMIVIDPDTVKTFTYGRWAKGDDRASFWYVPEDKDKVFCFATSAQDRENAEQVVVSRFLKEEGPKILEDLRKIKWKPQIDFTVLQKEYETVADMLKDSKDVGMKRKLAEIKAGIDAKDTATALSIQGKLADLKKDAAAAGLDSLFK